MGGIKFKSTEILRWRKDGKQQHNQQQQQKRNLVRKVVKQANSELLMAAPLMYMNAGTVRSVDRIRKSHKKFSKKTPYGCGKIKFQTGKVL